MKKTGVIIVSVLFLFILGTLAVIGVRISGQKRAWKQFEEQMDLGNRYLLEQNYEEAIVAFSKAIEIDPRQTESYFKMAEAYAALGDYKNAVLTLERGYEYTGDLQMKEQIELYEEFLNSQSMLEKLLNGVQEGDRETIWTLQKQENYQKLSGNLKEPLIWKTGDMFMVIYPCGHCYYGQMEQGKRSGHGIWCSYDSEQMDYYDGLWQEDYPNGDGKYWTVCVPVPEDLFYKQAQWADGLENGIVNSEYTSLDFYENSVFTEKTVYQAERGIRQKVEDLHPERKPISGKERYCYYSDSNGSDYAIEGHQYGIMHARKGVDEVKTVRKTNE